MLGHHGTDAQAGQTEPFGEAVDRDRALGIEPRGQDMIVGEIAIGAVMQDVGADLAGDVAERLDLCRACSRPQRIVWIDQIDDPRIPIDAFRAVAPARADTQRQGHRSEFRAPQRPPAAQTASAISSRDRSSRNSSRLAVGAAHGCERCHRAVGDERRRGSCGSPRSATMPCIRAVNPPGGA